MENTKIATFLMGLSAILVMDACSSSKSSSTNGMNMMLARMQIDNKTKNSDLDSQIVAVFAEMKKWTPGLVNNKPYDTAELYSFTIKKGKISVE